MAGALVPVLSFIGVTTVKIWGAIDHIATKADTYQLRQDMITDFKRTDEAIAKAVEASKKYTDEKAAQTIQEAFSHSDQNKLGIEAKFSAQYSDIAAKTQMILQMLDRIDRIQSAPKK